MEEELKYYRADSIPAAVLGRFDVAVKAVSEATDRRGEGQVSQAAAFCALVQAVDLDAEITAGQDLAELYSGEVMDRGFHLPAVVKASLVRAACRRGIKVGAAGRLVMIACAEQMRETIEAGLAKIEAGLAGAEQ